MRWTNTEYNSTNYISTFWNLRTINYVAAQWGTCNRRSNNIHPTVQCRRTSPYSRQQDLCSG